MCAVCDGWMGMRSCMQTGVYGRSSYFQIDGWMDGWKGS